MGKWGPIAIVALCLMGLLGIKCRYFLSIFISAGRRFAYEHSDLLMNTQIYPEPSPLFLIVSMSHSVVVIIYFYNMLKGISGNL